MTGGPTGNRRRIWSVVLGAAVGAALGIVVSGTIDIPVAPEAGLLLGGLVGWLSAAGLVANSWAPTMWRVLPLLTGNRPGAQSTLNASQ
jgi:hypothetical protein